MIMGQTRGSDVFFITDESCRNTCATLVLIVPWALPWPDRTFFAVFLVRRKCIAFEEHMFSATFRQNIAHALEFWWLWFVPVVCEWSEWNKNKIITQGKMMQTLMVTFWLRLSMKKRRIRTAYRFVTKTNYLFSHFGFFNSWKIPYLLGSGCGCECKSCDNFTFWTLFIVLVMARARQDSFLNRQHRQLVDVWNLRSFTYS